MAVTAEQVEPAAALMAAQELPITLVVELRQLEELLEHPAMVFLGMRVRNMPVEIVATKAAVAVVAGSAAGVAATTVAVAAVRVMWLR